MHFAAENRIDFAFANANVMIRGSTSTADTTQ